ncbi:hypothetical protein N7453_001428 [Penicillium expansum]|nr:hypothetical protein N7453_001428 [Penicillium expansum]
MPNDLCKAVKLLHWVLFIATVVGYGAELLQQISGKLSHPPGERASTYRFTPNVSTTSAIKPRGQMMIQKVGIRSFSDMSHDGKKRRRPFQMGKSPPKGQSIPISFSHSWLAMAKNPFAPFQRTIVTETRAERSVLQSGDTTLWE